MHGEQNSRSGSGFLNQGGVDELISIGPNFFYTMTLPCTLWFFDKAKTQSEREGTVLFIDVRNIYHQIYRAHRDFLPEQCEFIANIVRLYKGHEPEFTCGSEAEIREKFPEGIYADIPGLCKVATLEEIKAQGWSLNPGRYVGVIEREEDDGDFFERLEELNEELELLNGEARVLEERIAENYLEIIGLSEMKSFTKGR